MRLFAMLALLCVPVVAQEIGCGQYFRPEHPTMKAISWLEEAAKQTRQRHSDCAEQWIDEIRLIANDLDPAISRHDKDWAVRLEAAVWLAKNGNKEDRASVQATEVRLMRFSENRPDSPVSTAQRALDKALGKK